MAPPHCAVITGAGSGIGRAIAQRFHREGSHLLLVGRRRDKLEETRALLDTERIHLADLDVAEAGAMDDAVTAFVEAVGRVDALIANAGINPLRADTLHTDDANWDETIRVNLTGAHRSCKAVLPHMIEQHSGAIVTLGSISGQVGMAERAAYGPTKAGVIQYTRNLAVDYASHGIRANCICPGFVVTDLVRPWLDSRPAEVRAQIERAHPLGIGAPDDIAGVAWFLCSTDSRWITGTDLSVDGGFTCL